MLVAYADADEDGNVADAVAKTTKDVVRDELAGIKLKSTTPSVALLLQLTLPLHDEFEADAIAEAQAAVGTAEAVERDEVDVVGGSVVDWGVVLVVVGRRDSDAFIPTMAAFPEIKT